MKFPLLDPDAPAPELHPETTLDDEKELVLLVVVVPDELTEELGQLDVLAVQLAHDLWLPLFVEERQLLLDVHLLQAQWVTSAPPGAPKRLRS
jgi:hypothetical protein